MKPVKWTLPLSCWAGFCYAQHSRLFFSGDHIITSEEGGQQGDPQLGILWSLTLEENLPDVLARAADGEGALNFHVFFKDDGWVCGDDTAVARFLHALRELGPPHGIELGESKCELILAAGRHSLVDTGLFAGADSAANGIIVHTDAQFEILGAAVGCTIFASAETTRRARNA